MILAYVPSGIMGVPISLSSAASTIPPSAYCRPAFYTSSSRGAVTPDASGAMNIGLSGTVIIVCP